MQRYSCTATGQVKCTPTIFTNVGEVCEATHLFPDCEHPCLWSVQSHTHAGAHHMEACGNSKIADRCWGLNAYPRRCTFICSVDSPQVP